MIYGVFIVLLYDTMRKHIWVHQSNTAQVSLQRLCYDNVNIFEWIKFNKFVDANILLLWKEKHEKLHVWVARRPISCSTVQRTKVKRYIKSSNSIKKIQILCSTFTIEQYKGSVFEIVFCDVLWVLWRCVYRTGVCGSYSKCISRPRRCAWCWVFVQI